MNALLTSFVSGMVFALGLGISGMTRPGARRLLPRTRADLACFRRTRRSDLRRRDGGWDVAAHLGHRISRSNLGLGDAAVEEHAGCISGAGP